jgi:putative peptidoglycan lipid II flippase
VVVGGLTAASRVLGFVRDLLVARLFGASPIADAFFVAFRIPNTLRSFVAEGAMTSAFVPVFTDELRRGTKEARIALHSIFSLLITCTLGMVVLGILYAPTLVALFAPGFSVSPSQQELCVTLTRIMLPFVMCISVVSLLNGALNARGVFGAAAMAQIWMNVCLILGAVAAQWFENTTAAKILALSVVIGGLVQVGSQLPTLYRLEFSLRFTRNLLSPASRRMLTLMGPAIIGATIYQLGILTNTFFASTLQSGSVSWLFYADRIVQFPLGIFSVALASVLLPALSRSRSNDDVDLFSSQLSQSIKVTSFVIIPFCFGMYFFGKPLVSLLFERGAFGPSDVERTAEAIAAYCLGIWATSVYALLARGFIARQDTLTPMCIGLVSLSIVVVSSLALMGSPIHGVESAHGMVATIQHIRAHLQSWGIGASMGHVGLAYASSLGAWVSLACAATLLTRHVKLPMLEILASFTRALLASAVAVITAAFLVGESSPPLAVALGIPTAILGYILASFALRSEELILTLEHLKRTLKRQ